MTRTAFIIAAVAAAVLTGAVAHAAPDSDTVSMKVSVAGLDLSNPRDAQVAYSRIKAASTSACDYVNEDTALANVAQYNQCREDFTAKAVAQIGSPTLTQVATGASPIRLASH